MVRAHLRRGLLAGAVGGVAYGAFLAAVARPLIAHAESFEAAGGTGGAASSAVTAVASVGAGVLWGLLLGGLVLGVGGYLLEPALPGAPDTQGYLLAAAGFLTVSGGPWLAFPPQPPGVETALDTPTRQVWFLAVAVATAAAIGLALLAARRLRDRPRPVRLGAAALPFGLVGVAVWAAPPTGATGPAPEALVSAFRATVVAGQVGLWLVMASAHAWLVRRSGPGAPQARRP